MGWRKVCCWCWVPWEGIYQRHKSCQLVWWWLFFWFPDFGVCSETILSRPFLNLYSIVSLAFFLLDCNSGQSSSSSMAVMLGVTLSACTCSPAWPTLQRASWISQWSWCSWQRRDPIQDRRTPWVVSLELRTNHRLLPSPEVLVVVFPWMVCWCNGDKQAQSSRHVRYFSFNKIIVSP